MAPIDAPLIQISWSKKRKRSPRRLHKKAAELSPQVLEVIQEEKRKPGRRGPRDVEPERKKKKLAADGLRAIKAKDARTFTELLRQARIREGSPE